VGDKRSIEICTDKANLGGHRAAIKPLSRENPNPNDQSPRKSQDFNSQKAGFQSIWNFGDLKFAWDLGFGIFLRSGRDFFRESELDTLESIDDEIGI